MIATSNSVAKGMSGLMGCWALVLSLTGCGSSGPLEAADEEPVEASFEELISGASDVTGSVAGSQSETAIYFPGTNGVGALYAYNGDHSGVTYTDTTRTIQHGSSIMDYSFWNNSTQQWVHRSVSPPSGFSLLWADPALAGSGGHVFYSALASPDSKWGSASSITDDENTLGSEVQSRLGGACIARSTDGGKTFAILQCLINDNQDFYDGGSLAIAGTQLFAAYLVDSSSGRIEVWRSSTLGGTLSQTSDPFPGVAVNSHPILTASNGSMFIAVVDSSGVLRMSEWASTGWRTPVKVTSGISAQATPIAVRNNTTNRTVRHGPPFAYACGLGETGQVIDLQCRFLVLKHVSDAPAERGFYFQGARCRFTGMPRWTCGEISGWKTPADKFTNSFLPAVAVGGLGNNQFVWKASYWRNTYNSIAAQYSSATLVAASIRSPWTEVTITGPQTPCPDRRGYWGDYDKMAANFNGQSNMFFARGISDSTETCSPKLYDTNVHVSEVAIAP
jgi:hypothetical protein